MCAAQPEAVQAACRALGALAFGDPHTKRYLLSSGAAGTLISLLIHGTPVTTGTHTHTSPSNHLCNAPSGHKLSHSTPAHCTSTTPAVSAARALQNLALRSSSGEHSASELSEDGSGSECSLNPTISDTHASTCANNETTSTAEYSAEGSRRKQRKLTTAESAVVTRPPVSPAALAQAAAMLEVVLDSTSATAMQQLALAVDAAPLLGVATEVLGAVLGATAKVVSPFDCGKVSWTSAAACDVTAATPRGSYTGVDHLYFLLRFFVYSYMQNHSQTG